MKDSVQKIVLAYSGGLDTSVILKWLIETYSCEVVAFCADLGQGEELAPVEGKAKKTGATEVFIEDLREEFVRDFVFPMLRANAVYEGSYLLGTSIARPLIAARQIEVARRTGADAVAHGATGKGNDQVRFELTYYCARTRHPGDRPVARQWALTSRSLMIEFAGRHGIPVPVTAEKPYSMDRNLLHVSYEGGDSRGSVAGTRTRTCSSSRSRPRRLRTKPSRSRSTTRRANPGGGERRAALAGGAARQAERDRRPTRRSAGSTSSRTATSA